MQTPHSLPALLFDKIILNRPVLVIICLLTLVLFLGYHAKDFKLDASSETLVLENDQDLRYSRLISSRYGKEDYLVVTYTPKNEDLFSENTLSKLFLLKDELMKLERVTSVTSILDVPLLESPPVPVKELASNIRTLESPTVDRKLARTEFSNSPIYQNMLVSPDLKTTALQIKLKVDDTYFDLRARRNYYRERQATGVLTQAEAAEFVKVKDQFKTHRDKTRKAFHQDLIEIRVILDKYKKDAMLFLGGISMISDDMISYIKNDLKAFGLGVLIFLVITLGIIFRKIRWVLLPILCCTFSAVCMIGFLGMFGWEVTIISSNFISLQLIITMAISIHLIVRYRELHRKNPEAEQRELILNSVCLMFKPCLYTALTTIAGFGSLLFCGILPVITFGWMMSVGIIVSLILTFIFFPAELMLLKKGSPAVKRDSSFSLLSILARFTEFHGIAIMVISCIVLLISVIGISRLEVENSFIDYFKDTTEIYKGMKVVDRDLGGTTPLDVIIEFDELKPSMHTTVQEAGTGNDKEFEEFEEFDKPEQDKGYWFTSDKMAQIKKWHDYLDSIPETGKVLSLATVLKIGEKLNDDRPLDNFKLALLYKEMPDKFKEMILEPYVSIENNEVRFSIRVRDSEKTLKRNELLKKIEYDLINKFGIKKEHVHLTGMLVLYNNMLQSLFSSQILTLGIVVPILMCMFLILFRSLKIAFIAIFPNLLSIGVVLGVMGWIGIPLDMMTITIAAISVGIAVDDTIHYIHRFKREFQASRNYTKALHRCHESIGYAMYYTSLTIIIGFSILVLSNFIPSIYFGLFTGLAMLIALIAALTLLPQLLVFFKAFGPEVCEK